jgi:quercetin dioxygenase-like cupin family protein
LAATGDELRTLDGTTFLLVESAQDSAGQRVEFEIILSRGAPSPPPHFHPKQTEEWHVVDGVLSAYIDGSWRDLRAGESVSMRPGQVHTLRNKSAGTVRVRDVHIPAGDFQEYIEALQRLSETGKVKSLKDPRSLIHLSMLLYEHRRSGGQVTASAVQRLGETILSAVGRLLRYDVG